MIEKDSTEGSSRSEGNKEAVLTLGSNRSEVVIPRQAGTRVNQTSAQPKEVFVSGPTRREKEKEYSRAVYSRTTRSRAEGSRPHKPPRESEKRWIHPAAAAIGRYRSRAILMRTNDVPYVALSFACTLGALAPRVALATLTGADHRPQSQRGGGKAVMQRSALALPGGIEESPSTREQVGRILPHTTLLRSAF